LGRDAQDRDLAVSLLRVARVLLGFGGHPLVGVLACLAEPPLEAMISQALSPSGNPPRTVLRSFPDLAPIVVRMSTGKPMKVAGSGPWRF